MLNSLTSCQRPRLERQQVCSKQVANDRLPPNTPMVMTGRLGTRDRIGGDRSSGGESRPAVMVGCSRPLRARDRWFFNGRIGGALTAAERHTVSQLPSLLRSRQSPRIVLPSFLRL